MKQEKEKCKICGQKANQWFNINLKAVCICKRCHRRLHGINNDSQALFDEIKRRLEPFNIGEYKGILDMSATHDNSVEQCRKFNFEFMKKNFGDYIPNLKFEDFKLFCWKGGIGWNEDMNESECYCGNGEFTKRHTDFTGLPSEDIIFWVIKHKWGEANESRTY